jgi:hypothetical protein
MPFNVKKRIIRAGFKSGAVVLVVGLGLAKALGQFKITIGGIAPSLQLWLAMALAIMLALAVGSLSSWRCGRKIKSGFVTALQRPMSYVPIRRAAMVGDMAVDWRTIDGFASLLGARGYRPWGEFTSYPMSEQMTAVAAIFADHAAATVVEVQQIEVSNDANAACNGVRFSITSLVAGNIRVCTSNQQVGAIDYLNRGDYTVHASYPGMGLFELMEKHENVLAKLRLRTGKVPSCGLDMSRYLLLQRECQGQALARVSRMSGYDIATLIDTFELEPALRWAQTADWLKALPRRTLEELDATLQHNEQPPIIEMAAAA